MRKLYLLAIVSLLLPTLVFSQNRLITGKVTDDKGNPVSFATIKIKGTKSATTADESGAFRISVPRNTVLVISAVGSETKEVTVPESGGSIAVTLIPTNVELGAVTV